MQGVAGTSDVSGIVVGLLIVLAMAVGVGVVAEDEMLQPVPGAVYVVVAHQGTQDVFQFGPSPAGFRQLTKGLAISHVTACSESLVVAARFRDGVRLAGIRDGKLASLPGIGNPIGTSPVLSRDCRLAWIEPRGDTFLVHVRTGKVTTTEYTSTVALKSLAWGPGGKLAVAAASMVGGNLIILSDGRVVDQMGLISMGTTLEWPAARIVAAGDDVVSEVQFFPGGGYYSNDRTQLLTMTATDRDALFHRGDELGVVNLGDGTFGTWRRLARCPGTPLDAAWVE